MSGAILGELAGRSKRRTMPAAYSTADGLPKCSLPQRTMAASSLPAALVILTRTPANLHLACIHLSKCRIENFLRRPVAETAGKTFLSRFHDLVIDLLALGILADEIADVVA